MVSSGGGGGCESGTLKCGKTNLTLDLAKPNVKSNLNFTVSEIDGYDYCVSMDVRKGYPTTVTHHPEAISEHGTPVLYNKSCTLTPKSVGSETISFELVHLVEVDGYGRFFNTSYGTTVDVTVMCSDLVVTASPIGTISSPSRRD